MHLAIIGNGFVGQAMAACFRQHYPTTIYDKYQSEHSQFEPVMEADLVFVSVPTPKGSQGYDLTNLHEVMGRLSSAYYKGIVVIKSTVLPGTTASMSQQYGLQLVNNPEFLTARTAKHDFANQSHIVIGGEPTSRDRVAQFYQTIFPNAEYTLVKSMESESIKIFCNAFYATKLQVFNEFYLLCLHTGADFNTVVGGMLKNNWINPMHTKVPGPDGQLSFGGGCFPKDLGALVQYCENQQLSSQVLRSVLKERNQMRSHKNE